MNWKGCGRKWSWPNLRYYLGIFLEGLRNTTKVLSQDNRSLRRELNQKPLEYKEGLITTQLRRFGTKYEMVGSVVA
jgi:hypothetical protein